MAKTDILLEVGTNEIEIMKFKVHDELYGINVAKVREIMVAGRPKPVPHSHKAVEGIFKPREELFTVVNLPYYLTQEDRPFGEKDLFMITHFNNAHIAFRVNSVVGIQRVSWEEIQKPEKFFNNEEESIATGIVSTGDELVIILDFEKIMVDIVPELGLCHRKAENIYNIEREHRRVLMAEDSVFLSKLIIDALYEAGYTRVDVFNNGKELWDYLEENIDCVGDPNNNKNVDLIITDIEMPQMDGHRLIKLVKSNYLIKHIPIIIFSSLINDEMKLKGWEVGADEQLSKPEIAGLVEMIDKMLYMKDEEAK